MSRPIIWNPSGEQIKPGKPTVKEPVQQSGFSVLEQKRKRKQHKEPPKSLDVPVEE